MRRPITLLCAFVACGVLGAALLPATAATRPPSGPEFRQYVAPEGVGDFAGEPSIGVNKSTGAVLLLAGTQALRVTQLDAEGPGSAQWTDVTPLLPGWVSLDPILFTDQHTGRTFVSQLTGYCSQMAYTDDDGAHWHDSLLGCGVGTTFDHQTVGGGPPARRGAQPSGGYRDNVYYCAHDVVAVHCATSTNGGATFGVTSPAFTNTGDCIVSSGHIRVAPDGTVYVPPKQCDRGATVAVSEDNGGSWSLRRVDAEMYPDARAGDPTVAVADDNTVYLAWAAPHPDDPHATVPRIAVSRNHGHSWFGVRTLGSELGIRNVTFPTVVAGDGDRAAVAFYGSTTGGDDQVDSWRGTWRLYVAYTFDRGRTWTTTLAMRQPVQVGMICLAGTVGCPGDTRNLLDFNDVTLDRRGRVLVAATVGCVKSSGCTSNDRLQKLTFVRQVRGKGLYRRFDG